jgi:hypothetical protein
MSSLSKKEDLPNFYVRSKIAHEPVITFSEDELKSKSKEDLNKIQDYHINTLKLLVGSQVLDILHNINTIDKLLER